MTAGHWATSILSMVLSVGTLLAAAQIQPGAAGVPKGIVAFQHFGLKEGLENISVTAVAQDSEGFVWVGTDQGLFRLEGGRFRLFDTSHGLPSNRIEFGGLSAGVRQGLWVSTGKGLSFWNGQHFQRPSELGLSGLDNRPGVPLNQGGTILSNFAAQLRYVSLSGEPFQPLHGLPWGKGLTAGTYSAGLDRLVLALNTELWVRDHGAWTHRDLSATFAEPITALWIDGQGRIFLRSKEILASLASMDGALQVLATPVGLSTINNCGLGMDNQGRLWTNTAEGVVWVKDNESGFIGETEGLPQGGADLLRVDRQGSLWLGGEGMHRILGEGLWTGYTRHQGLPADVVWSVARTRDGLTWAGTAGGLAVSDGRGWQLLPGTRAVQIMALEEDADGNLWSGHTLSREQPQPLSVRPAGTRTLRPVKLPLLPIPLRVGSLFADGQNLWLGTSPGGLVHADRTGTTLSNLAYVAVPGWPKATVVNRVVTDQGGGLWAGGSNGIAHWNGKTWATLSRDSGLPDNEVLTIAGMPGLTAWFSFAETTALCRVKRQGDQLILEQTIRPPHPLLKQPVVTLACGPDGALWLGTSAGLLRWNGQHIERFGTDTGFPGEDCCQNALTFDADGDPWVGVSVGLVHGKLSQGRRDQAPPGAILTEALQGDGRSLLHSTVRQTVPWKARTLTFGYCPRGSQLPDGLTYQVRLLGLEDAWRRTTLPEARYPGLAPGQYQFEVRVVTWTGEVGPATVLAFQILAPWWLRPWAWVLAALAMVGGGTLTYRWRTTLLRQRNAKLEALVQDRTRDLKEANLALEEASLVDPLTSLRNRRYLEISVVADAHRAQRLYEELNAAGKDPQAEKEAMVFFLIDLDHFKKVNDQWGHAAGDAVLVQFGEVLRSVTRSSDTLIRWGGEEFLVVTKRVRHHDATRIAQSLLEAVNAKAFLLPNGQTIPVTCSIGLIPFPLHPDHPELGSWRLAIEMADQCLYAAKHSGRNRWIGAFIRPGADPEPFARMDAWEVQWAVEHGLMEAKASEPGLQWAAPEA